MKEEISDEIESLFIEGMSPKGIARTLDVPIIAVLDVLEELYNRELEEEQYKYVDF